MSDVEPKPDLCPDCLKGSWDESAFWCEYNHGYIFTLRKICKGYTPNIQTRIGEK